ncbi:hypothetical protein DIE15_01395 [Burkholderia sp. Bp9031]|uniref:hypothetical protein n=1 Tax=Burkholderia sp. Bp9031 TaxID=2184566 RepID=UPI000F5E7571|nr:hypothetical protein [Burkholderia sp. Bp9031]RQZ20754.1 hypothetical protein DIE15_01395 [Burkholderia sp. Bp9031]
MPPQHGSLVSPNGGDYGFKSSRGGAAHGDRKIENGKLCSKALYLSNDVRVKGEDLYRERADGEIVQFVESH